MSTAFYKNPKIIGPLILVVVGVSLLIYFLVIKKGSSTSNGGSTTTPNPTLSTTSTPSITLSTSSTPSSTSGSTSTSAPLKSTFSKGSSGGAKGGAGGILLKGANNPSGKDGYGDNSGLGGTGFGAGGGAYGSTGGGCPTENGGDGAPGFVYIIEDEKLFTSTDLSYKATRKGSYTFVLMGGGGGGGCSSGGDSGELIVYNFPIIGIGWTIKITVGSGGTSTNKGGDSIVQYTSLSSTTTIVARGAKPANIINFPEVFGVGPYAYTKDEGTAKCKSYGAEVATYDQLADAQQHGADWCSAGWVKDRNDAAYYPITTSLYPGCGGGLQGIMRYTPDNKAGVNCYGIKPKSDSNILPFQLSTKIFSSDNSSSTQPPVTNTYYYQPYDSSASLYEIPRQDYNPLSLGGINGTGATEIPEDVFNNLNTIKPTNTVIPTTTSKPFNPVTPIPSNIIQTGEYYLQNMFSGYTMVWTDTTYSISKYLLLSERDMTNQTFAKFLIQSSSNIIYNKSQITLKLTSIRNSALPDLFMANADMTFKEAFNVINRGRLFYTILSDKATDMDKIFTIQKVDIDGNFVNDDKYLEIGDKFVLIIKVNNIDMMVCTTFVSMQIDPLYKGPDGYNEVSSFSLVTINDLNTYKIKYNACIFTFKKNLPTYSGKPKCPHQYPSCPTSPPNKNSSTTSKPLDPYIDCPNTVIPADNSSPDGYSRTTSGNEDPYNSNLECPGTRVDYCGNCVFELGCTPAQKPVCTPVPTTTTTTTTTPIPTYTTPINPTTRISNPLLTNTNYYLNFTNNSIPIYVASDAEKDKYCNKYGIFPTNDLEINKDGSYSAYNKRAIFKIIKDGNNQMLMNGSEVKLQCNGRYLGLKSLTSDCYPVKLQVSNKPIILLVDNISDAATFKIHIFMGNDDPNIQISLTTSIMFKYDNNQMLLGYGTISFYDPYEVYGYAVPGFSLTTFANNNSSAKFNFELAPTTTLAPTTATTQAPTTTTTKAPTTATTQAPITTTTKAPTTTTQVPTTTLPKCQKRTTGMTSDCPANTYARQVQANNWACGKTCPGGVIWGLFGSGYTDGSCNCICTDAATAGCTP